MARTKQTARKTIGGKSTKQLVSKARVRPEHPESKLEDTKFTLSKTQMYQCIMQAVFETCQRVLCEMAWTLEAKIEIVESITKSAESNSDGTVYLSDWHEECQLQAIELVIGDKLKFVSIWIHWCGFTVGEMLYASGVSDTGTNCSLVTGDGRKQPNESGHDSRHFFHAADNVWCKRDV